MSGSIPLYPSSKVYYKYRIRLPITVLMLGRIKMDLFNSSNPEKVVIWAVACTAFFGFFWLGELLPESRRTFVPATDLSWGDVAVDNHSSPHMIQIHPSATRWAKGQT